MGKLQEGEAQKGIGHAWQGQEVKGRGQSTKKRPKGMRQSERGEGRPRERGEGGMRAKCRRQRERGEGQDMKS